MKTAAASFYSVSPAGVQQPGAFGIREESQDDDDA